MGGDLIQTPQTRWIQGAYESVTRGTPVHLNAFLQATAGNPRWSGFRQFRTSTTYIVPPNRSLYISEILFFTSTNGTPLSLADGSNDVGINSDASPTDPIHINAPALPGYSILNANNVLTRYQLHYTATIPTGRYIYAYTPAGTAFAIIDLHGHEE